MIFKYLEKTPQFATPFQGWIADSARVIGDVYLGHQANVWFGAVIRCDNERINI
ncbi:MAG TPA: gamma carbonic anhydrase family protein, partial [Psychrobacter sp.]|nr:gamma carbonic anhydrase family protein [Psychrobacter sp.]